MQVDSKFICTKLANFISGPIYLARTLIFHGKGNSAFCTTEVCKLSSNSLSRIWVHVRGTRKVGSFVFQCVKVVLRQQLNRFLY
jgi:hypothetical protein